MNEAERIMQLMDDLETLYQTATEIESAIFGAIILLKIHELRSVLEAFLTTELE